MPESTAAASLPPTAYTCRPKVVLEARKAAAAPNASINQMGTGTPAIVPEPRTENPVLPNSGLPSRLGKVAPSEISRADPRATYKVPSVAINGATENRETNSPLTAPTSAPASTARTTTSQVWKYTTTP